MPEHSLTYDDVQIGADIPPYTIALTLQRLVMEAGVNRDFAPQHHDPELARASGAPDVFANTTLLQTLFEVTLRQWMGLAGRLRKLGFRMHGLNCIGHDLTCAGRVKSKRTEDGRGLVELEVWQELDTGERTVSGSAVVELPLQPV